MIKFKIEQVEGSGNDYTPTPPPPPQIPKGFKGITLDLFTLPELVRLQLVSKCNTSDLDLREFQKELEDIADRMNDKFKIHPLLYM